LSASSFLENRKHKADGKISLRASEASQGRI
jgi:hypothetical protein